MEEEGETEWRGWHECALRAVDFKTGRRRAQREGPRYYVLWILSKSIYAAGVTSAQRTPYEYLVCWSDQRTAHNL